MERIARTDFLLGIANRRFTQTELTERITHAGKFGTKMSVVLMDIDHFKHIHDTYGHNVGDVVPVEVSSVLQRVLYEPNFFGCWGDEEFLMILPGCSKMEASTCAEQLRAAIEAHYFPIGQVTTTFEVAECRTGDNFRSILKRAGNALYNGIQLGRNRVDVS